jgi:hypothetical protein
MERISFFLYSGTVTVCRYGTEPTNPLKTGTAYTIIVAYLAVFCILEMNLSVICRYVIDYYDGDLDPGSHR